MKKGLAFVPYCGYIPGEDTQMYTVYLQELYLQGRYIIGKKLGMGVSELHTRHGIVNLKR